MPNILTIHNDKATASEHWFERQTAYDFGVIEKIADPKAGKTKEPPTSIPSPFARFDLVKTAFARLAGNKDLRGEFNDERLVSEALDVAQIFFNADKFQDRISIIPWSKDVGIDNLKHSGSPGHRKLAKVLELFLTQDGGIGQVVEGDKKSGGYNFDYMREIYILKYQYGNERGVIGGTSPSTLFFSSPNSSKIKVDIKFGNHQVFGSKPCALHERDVEFIKFLYGISRITDFSKFFPELSKYIEVSEQLLFTNDQQKHKKIGSFAECQSAYENFPDLVDSKSGHVEVINGFKVKKASNAVETGDFVLITEKFKKQYPGQLPPMILAEGYRGKLKYTVDIWDPGIPVPYYMEESWNSGKRRLPAVGMAYPWLTVNDLFEPVLFRLIYPLNSSYFFDVEAAEKERQQSYLIPLKSIFFDFFDAEELVSPHSGRVALSFKNYKTYAEAELTIAIKTGEPPLKLAKRYTFDKPEFTSLSADAKEGYVEDIHFSLNIMPFIRISNPEFNPLYHVMITDRDVTYNTIGNQYNISFVDSGNNKLGITNSSTSRQKNLMDEGSATTKHYTLTSNFDLILIKIGPFSNYLLPKFFNHKRTLGGNAYTLSVDFGTTNTHVELNSSTQKEPIAFSYQADELMKVSTIDFKGNLKHFVDEAGFPLQFFAEKTDLIPNEIGPGKEVSFPIRTVGFEPNKNGQQIVINEGFHKAVPGYLYEKFPLKERGEIYSNLKWSNNQTFKSEIEAYLDVLLFSLRNRVLLNSGNPATITLLWFYPLSMPSHRRHAFYEIWERLAKRNFSNQVKIQEVLESTAPFYYYRYGMMDQAISASTYPVVNIDIGGETTDIVVYKNNKEELISSFRFAGNVLFGDALNLLPAKANDNGFVRKYTAEVLDCIKDTEMGKVFASIKTEDRAHLVNSFFFSLKSWKNPSNQKSFDYQEKLKNDENLKIVFFIYYYSVIYHVAQILKSGDLQLPRHITLSGKGSGIVNFLSGSEKAISSLTKEIFEMVYGTEYHKDGLDVHHKLEFKKEATCKGAIIQLMINGSIAITSKEICKVHPGFGDNFFDKTKHLTDINDLIKNELLVAYQKFIDGIQKINTTVNLKDLFGIDTSKMSEYAEIMTKDMATNLTDSLEFRKRETDESDLISETLFFYPIIPALKRLINHVTKSN